MSSGVGTSPRDGAAGPADLVRRAAPLLWLAAGAFALAVLVYALALGVDDLMRIDRDLRFPQVVGDWRFRDAVSADFARACEVGAVVAGSALLLGTLLVAGVRRAVLVACVAGAGPAITAGVSWMLESTDPLGGEALRASQGAFPSDHAALALSLGLGLVVALPPRLRPVGGLVAVAVAISIATGVIALGWHYPSDVAGGFLISLAGAALVAAAAVMLGGAPSPAPAGAVRRSVAFAAAALLLAAAMGIVALAALPDESAGTFVRMHTPFVVFCGGAALLAIASVGLFVQLIGGEPGSGRRRTGG